MRCRAAAADELKASKHLEWNQRSSFTCETGTSYAIPLDSVPAPPTESPRPPLPSIYINNSDTRWPFTLHIADELCPVVVVVCTNNGRWRVRRSTPCLVCERPRWPTPICTFASSLLHLRFRHHTPRPPTVQQLHGVFIVITQLCITQDNHSHV